MDNVEQVFERIMVAKKWQKQQLAEYIDVDPSTLSQKLGTHWNAHWRIFVKLLPLMVELKIINPKQLYGMSDKCEAKTKNSEHANSLNIKENVSKPRHRKRYIMSTLISRPVLSQ